MTSTDTTQENQSRPSRWIAAVLIALVLMLLAAWLAYRAGYSRGDADATARSDVLRAAVGTERQEELESRAEDARQVVDAAAESAKRELKSAEELLEESTNYPTAAGLREQVQEEVENLTTLIAAVPSIGDDEDHHYSAVAATGFLRCAVGAASHHHEKLDENVRALISFRGVRDETVLESEAAQALFNDTEGEVLDDATRAEISACLAATAGVADLNVEGQGTDSILAAVNEIETAKACLAPARSGVESSHEAWKAEQKRLAEEEERRAAEAERVAQERARQQEEAAAQPRQSSGSSSPSGSSPPSVSSVPSGCYAHGSAPPGYNGPRCYKPGGKVWCPCG
nr:hypothetical protein [Actinomycetales bacterium]